MAEPASEPAKRRWIVEVLVVVLLFVGLRAWQAHDLPSGTLPSLALETLDGEHVSLGAREHGYVVHFFATWCEVCRAEEGNVASLAEGTEVIAIASQSGSASDVRAYVEGADLTAAHVVLDPDGALAQRFGVRAFPTTLYVDRDGDVRTAEVGYTSTLGMQVRAWLVR